MTSNKTTKDSGPQYVPAKIRRLEQRLQENEYELEAWNSLIRDAQTQTVNKARKVYDRVVSQFPTTGRYWKIYIEHELVWT